MSVLNNPQPTNLELPTPPVGEAGQNGTLVLWQAQTEWLAKVGIVCAPDAASQDRTGE
jgi:hypothetical protein